RERRNSIKPYRQPKTVGDQQIIAFLLLILICRRTKPCGPGLCSNAAVVFSAAGYAHLATRA
ncbi:MAG: hypothetical protein LBU34_15465, partial [Planctomycetaceae bacterium]|nr:hypothetical protein [Planctomycetaceae bacterium]